MPTSKPKSDGPSSASTDLPPNFDELGLCPPLLAALKDVGYTQATSIQAQTIPALLEGRDLIGQAQTGTGKTAAFALPLLQGIDLKSQKVQGLILTPTREIALQVTEAIQTYSKHMGRVSVVSLVGGQSIVPQLKNLQKGAHIVVGTPGRVMDHLRRKTLKLDELQKIILDEADEMLRMGFIEDVEWILEHTPEQRQVILFSATMPKEIQHVTKKHTKDPLRIRVAQKEMTLPNIEQGYWMVQGLHKLDALTRILEAETLEAAIIFSRTRAGCAELAESLGARGHRAEALHGDMSQAARELVVQRMKSGKLQLIVATDVAARGLDIEGISHVINYDIPTDVEVYVHRIGRTGRAGRSGKAILFVTTRERHMLRRIEHFTKQKIEPMKLPSYLDVVAKRADILKRRLLSAAEKTEALTPYQKVIDELVAEGHDPTQIGAAALRLAAGEKPLEIREPQPKADKPRQRDDKPFVKRRRPTEASGFKAKTKHGARPSSRPGKPDGKPGSKPGKPFKGGFKKSEGGAPKPRGRRTLVRKMSKR